MNNTLRTLLLISAFQIFSVSAFPQGSLTPPGAPAATMKTLDQIEPRTPISSLPFTISTSGSYFVTGNLTSASTGLSVAADNVTIDLGGFTLTGPGGGGGGVIVNSRVNVTVRNGTVRNWTIGINGGGSTSGLRVENVRTFNNTNIGIILVDNGTATQCEAGGNGGDGIRGRDNCKIIGCTSIGQTGTANGILVSDNGMLVDCISSGNPGGGIVAGASSTMRGCVASGNAGQGISTGSNSALHNCAANSNGGNGFSISIASVMNNCTANENAGSAGIQASSSCVIIGCTARSNSSSTSISSGIATQSESLVSQCVVSDTETSNGTLTSATGAGISVANGSTVERCTIQGCTGDGIKGIGTCVITDNHCDGNGAGTGDGAGVHTTSTKNRIEGNQVTNNDRGIHVDGPDSLIIKNTASGNTTAYQIAADNRFGPIVNITATGIAAQNINDASANVGSSVVSTDPWANFLY